MSELEKQNKRTSKIVFNDKEIIGEEIQINAIGNHYGNLELLKDGESYYMRMQDCESQEWRMIPRKLAKHLIKYQNLCDSTDEIEDKE